MPSTSHDQCSVGSAATTLSPSCSAEEFYPLWSIYDPSLPKREPAQLSSVVAFFMTRGDRILNRLPAWLQRLTWRAFAPTSAPCPDHNILSGDIAELSQKGILRFILDKAAAYQSQIGTEKVQDRDAGCCGSVSSHASATRPPWILFRMGPVPAMLTLDMDTTMKILLSRDVKRGLAYSRLTQFFGYGIFTSRVPSRWRYQRDIIIDLFRRSSLEAMAVTLYTGMLDEVRKASERSKGQSLDFVLLLSRMGLIAFCDAALGVDVRDMSDELAGPINRLLTYINGALELICVPFGEAYQKFMVDRNFVHEWMRRLMRRVRKQAREGVDQGLRIKETPLSRAILDLDDPKRDEEVVEFMISMVLGGHETTARLMLGGFYALLRHPHYIERIRAEMKSYLDSGRAEPLDYRCYSENRMPFLRLVVEESLRLYPPVWLLARCPVVDLEIGGHTIPKGTEIFISPMILQRQKAVWGKDAEFFRPERFKELSIEQLRMFRPFVAGPEQCPGREFAKVESMLAFAGLFHHFDIRLSDPNQREQPTSAGTFRLFRELFVTIHPRKISPQ